MKKLLLLFIPVLFFFSCEEEIEETGPKYACSDIGCVEDPDGFHDSLESCQTGELCCQTCSISVLISNSPYNLDMDWSLLGVSDASEYEQYLESQYEDATLCGSDLEAYQNNWEDIYEDYDEDGHNDMSIVMICL